MLQKPVSCRVGAGAYHSNSFPYAIRLSGAMETSKGSNVRSINEGKWFAKSAATLPFAPSRFPLEIDMFEKVNDAIHATGPLT